MSVVQSVAHAVEPWQSLYNNSKAVATSVIFSPPRRDAFRWRNRHRRGSFNTARKPRDGRDKIAALRELDLTHNVVITALVVSFISGLALAAADVKNFASSPVFWTKMTLVALLLVNGWFLRSTEQRSAARVHRRRSHPPLGAGSTSRPFSASRCGRAYCWQERFWSTRRNTLSRTRHSNSFWSRNAG